MRAFTRNPSMLDALKRDQAHKYETLEILEGVRNAVDTLSYLIRRTAEHGEDLSSHAEGLYQLHEAQSRVMKDAEERIRNQFERADARETNDALDDEFFRWKLEEAERRLREETAGPGFADPEAVQLRMAIIREKLNAGQSPMTIAAAMNLPPRLVQQLVDRLRGVDPVVNAKIING